MQSFGTCKSVKRYLRKSLNMYRRQASDEVVKGEAEVMLVGEVMKVNSENGRATVETGSVSRERKHKEDLTLFPQYCRESKQTFTVHCEAPETPLFRTFNIQQLQVGQLVLLSGHFLDVEKDGNVVIMLSGRPVYLRPPISTPSKKARMNKAHPEGRGGKIILHIASIL